MNSFIDEIYNLALGDSVFENCRLMKANDFEKLNFPVKISLLFHLVLKSMTE